MFGFSFFSGNPSGPFLEAGQPSISEALNCALEFALADWAKLTRVQRAQPLTKGDEILDILLELRGPVVGVLRLRAARLLGRELAVLSTGAPEAWDFPEAALHELGKQCAEALIRIHFEEPGYVLPEPNPQGG
jgi:hypothetical protein